MNIYDIENKKYFMEKFVKQTFHPPTENDDIPKNKSISIKRGTKNFALIGKGKNNSISFELGKENAKATKTPYIAPEAPTITLLNPLMAAM